MKRRALAAVLVFALPMACTIVNGLRVPPPTSAPPEAGDTCDHARYPAPPVNGDQHSKSDIVVAVRHFDLGLGTTAPTFGFDLDGICTTCGADGGAGHESCVSPTPHCDDPQGRDNATQPLFRHLSALQIDIEARLNANIEGGFSTFVIRVQDYNGLPDDPEVLVSVFGSYGIRQTLDDGGRGYAPPAFDGGDSWSVNRDQLVPDIPDKYVSTRAHRGYVAGHVLVVPGGTASLPSLAGVTVDIDDLVLVATIDATGTSITDGTVAGRWPVESALKLAGELSVPSVPDLPLCSSPQLFDTVLKTICPAADLTVDGGASTCDALSLAFGFRTAPALLGEILDESPAPARCQDPSIFHCP